jgi:lipoprotein-anchoring transpeptidase ErfK/SrfK
MLYRGDTIVAVSTVSTGRKGHSTPTGTFRITEKHAVHFSNKYDNAPMPHMQRLTNDGIALHAGYIPGRPASHGCVRLPAKFAAALFKVTSVGTPVTIVQ